MDQEQFQTDMIQALGNIFKALQLIARKIEEMNVSLKEKTSN